MPVNRPDEPAGTPSGGQLYEFVDPAHEVTEEERNRPRYGRPPRKPAPEAPTQPKDEKAQ